MNKLDNFKKLKGFLMLWGSQAVSELGTAMTTYALTLWVYEQQGTATSLTTLTLCTFMPTILFRFLAGTLADRWNKKYIMLAADLFAALGTLTILALYASDGLRVWHLYIINTLLSFMNAVQVPASYAATSLLVPKEHYTRAGGLQGISGAFISILSPALSGVLLTLGGMKVVLLIDLATFAAAFTVLLFGIRIPKTEYERSAQEPFMKSCLDGIRYLWQNKEILHLTLFLAAVNFLAKLGNDGMLAPFILANTGNDRQILGLVQSFVSIGLLTGSTLVAIVKVPKDKAMLVYSTTALIFAGVIVQSLTKQVWLWCAAALLSYLFVAVMNANLMAMLRESIPQQMQGRAFSARDTLQNCTIPLGIFLGGVLADHVFEPFMSKTSFTIGILGAAFGKGEGAGIALQFFCVGLLGILMSILCLILNKKAK